MLCVFNDFCCNISLVSLSGRAELPQKKVFCFLENELLDEPLGIHFGIGPASSELSGHWLGCWGWIWSNHPPENYPYKIRWPRYPKHLCFYTGGPPCDYMWWEGSWFCSTQWPAKMKPGGSDPVKVWPLCILPDGSDSVKLICWCPFWELPWARFCRDVVFIWKCMNFPDSISAEGGVPKSGMCLQKVSQGLDYIIKFGSCPRPVKGSPPFPPDKEIWVVRTVLCL